MDLVADQPDAGRTTGLFHVPVICADVHYAGHPSTVTGREGAFVESDFLHRLRLENREYAEHVVDIVDRHPIQQDEVLIGSSSADVNT